MCQWSTPRKSTVRRHLHRPNTAPAVCVIHRRFSRHVSRCEFVKWDELREQAQFGKPSANFLAQATTASADASCLGQTRPRIGRIERSNRMITRDFVIGRSGPRMIKA
jgi:hypothetical protein